MSIHRDWRKIKTIWSYVVLMATTTLCFSLGLISGRAEVLPVYHIVKAESSNEEPVLQGDKSAIKGNFVASKTGKKYYPSWCKAVGRIKDSNKVWFETEDEAKSRGLTLSTAC